MINFMKVNFINNNCNIVHNGKYNMEYDMKLLDFAIENKIDYAFLRFYQWYPKCLSLGRNQDEKEFNNVNIDIVKRPSGGRALLHDRELTYSFICPIFDDSVVNSYKKISSALILAFKKFDIELEFSRNSKENTSYCMLSPSYADISYQNRKFIGSAQYRKQGYLLQHGSIPYVFNYKELENIFNKKINKDEIISLIEINKNISTRALIDAICCGFKDIFEKKYLFLTLQN